MDDEILMNAELMNSVHGGGQRPQSSHTTRDPRAGWRRPKTCPTRSGLAADELTMGTSAGRAQFCCRIIEYTYI